MKSKYEDTLFDLIKGYCDGRKYNSERLRDALRDCHKVLEDENGVRLSERAIKVCKGKTVVKRNVGKPKEVTIEHIIPVRFVLDQLIKIYKYKTDDRKYLEDYIENTFYAVYKLKVEEKDIVELDAEKLIQESFREPDKIQYFEEFCNKHWGECKLRELE